MIDNNVVFNKDWEIKFGILNWATNKLVQDFPDPDILVFDSYEDAFTDPVMWNKELYKVVKVKRTYIKTIYEYEVIDE
jgi:hypothetical protein